MYVTPFHMFSIGDLYALTIVNFKSEPYQITNLLTLVKNMLVRKRTVVNFTNCVYIFWSFMV
jgi:hypothetical protein